MPAFATHYIFFDELKEALEKEADFKLDTKVAGVGAQGPDIFLFHRLWPPVTIYKALMGVSSALHRNKPEYLFDAFAEYLKITEHRDIAKSYIYGFILHYALDRNCHPYVYALQNEICAEDRHIHSLAAHNRVEHSVDTYLLYHRKGVYPPSLFDPDETFTNDSTALAEIGRLMHYVIKKCNIKDVPEKEVIKAVTDTAKLQSTLADKKGGASRLAHIIETPLGPVTGYFKLSCSIKPKDLEMADKYANIKKRDWTSPYSGITDNSSFEELFEGAKPDAIALIKGFEALCRGEKTAYEVTNNISFLTGLEVTE